jgi:hypothetical protein
MNDFDWVVAQDEDAAIEWYEKEYGEPVDREDVRECDIDNEGQYVDFNDSKRISEFEAEGAEEIIVPVEGNPRIRGFGSIVKFGCEWKIKVPFREVLPVDLVVEPYITATTEW